MEPLSLATAMTTSGVSETIKALLEPVKIAWVKKFTETAQDFAQYFDDGLAKYLSTQERKIETTKTFLYRDGVAFYDVYFPITLQSQSKERVKIKVENNIFTELFTSPNAQTKHGRAFVTIIGEAGSGKSMLVRHIFLQSIKSRHKIPIFLELRYLNDFDGDFSSFVEKKMLNDNVALFQRTLEETLKSGMYLFLLDGFDEIYSKKKDKITQSIDSFIDKYPDNYFLVSSRPGINAESMPRFENFRVCPLDGHEQVTFIKKQALNDEDRKLSTEKIIRTIQAPENAQFNTYLQSPLLLSMFILTFELYPQLPSKRSIFYRNVFEALSTKHDTYSKAGGFLRERKSRLQNDSIEEILRWFAYTSLCVGYYSFEEAYLRDKLKEITEKLGLFCNIDYLIYDLSIGLSILVLDGLEYRFPHKSMQEYFTALLLKSLPEKKKKEIYSQILPNLFYYSYNDHDFHFWSLCEEIDKIDFYTYFVLPVLKKEINKLKKGDNQILNQLLEYGLSFEIVKKLDPQHDGIFYYDYDGANYTSNINIALSNFINAKNVILTCHRCMRDWLKFDKQNSNKFLIDIESNGYLSEDKNYPTISNSDEKMIYYTLSIKNLPADVLSDFLLAANFLPSLKERSLDLQNKVKEKEGWIKEEERKQQSLLNI